MSDRAAKTDKKRLGRPPGPPDSVRPHRIVTFVTSPEFKRLRELADTSGSSLSAIVHELVSRGLKGREMLHSDKVPSITKTLPADPKDRVGFSDFIISGRVKFEEIVKKVYENTNKVLGTNVPPPE